MRRFQLVRDRDISGVSGTGVVADGVLFDDGHVATRWRAKIAQTCAWDSIDHVEAIHGHGGATRIVWIDPGNDAAELDDRMGIDIPCPSCGRTEGRGVRFHVCPPTAFEGDV